MRTLLPRPASRWAVLALLLVACFECVGLGFARSRADGDEPPPAPGPAPAPAPAPGPAPAPERAPADVHADRARLRSDMDRLTDTSLGSRATAEERERAAAWIESQLTAVPLVAPAGRVDRIPVRAADGVPEGVHVMGTVRGSIADEIVLVVTHFDGKRGPVRAKEGGEGIPGREPRRHADAHASGVAALLEAARLLAKGLPPRRTVVFVAFDLAAPDLAGPRAFLAAPPFPLANVVAVLAVERVGRSLGDAFPGTTFVFGAETAAVLEQAVGRVGASCPAALRSLRLDLSLSPEPDSLPFEERLVPCLLVTGGRSRDDADAKDLLAGVDFEALAARTEILLSLIRAVADAPDRPVWREPPPPAVAEVSTALALLEGLATREAGLRLPESVRTLRAQVATILREVVARGSVKVGERAALRILLLQVFESLLPVR